MLGFRSPINALTPFVHLQILNHALFLKRFLCSFFERGLSIYSQGDFVRAGYPDWVRGRYTQMFDVAKVHRDFLESAITSAGSERVRLCNVQLCVYTFAWDFQQRLTIYNADI